MLTRENLENVELNEWSETYGMAVIATAPEARALVLASKKLALACLEAVHRVRIQVEYGAPLEPLVAELLAALAAADVEVE